MDDLLELARRRGYEHAAADVVEQLRQTQEDAVEVFRQFHLMWGIKHPSWEEAESWFRTRLTPL